MNFVDGIDWGTVLLPHTPIVEIVIRGSLLYVSVYLLMRFILKRESGSLAVNDLLVLVLLADAGQNAMAGDYKSVPDGILLIGVIIFWASFVNWLGYHLPWAGRIVHPPPMKLVERGRLVADNLGQELVTWEELMSELRLQGVSTLDQVEAAYMEGNGKVSVITRDAAGKARGNQRDDQPQ
jgi:uncharacterized membrane protein YcaP (DUF421 family)